MKIPELKVDGFCLILATTQTYFAVLRLSFAKSSVVETKAHTQGVPYIPVSMTPAVGRGM